MKFSERHGYTKAREKLQFESMDIALRNGLWDATYMVIKGDNALAAHLRLGLWLRCLGRTLDSLPQEKLAIATVREFFFDAHWFEIYDTVEFVAGSIAKQFPQVTTFHEIVRATLRREVAAYQLLGDIVSPITDLAELAAIDEATSSAVDGARAHLAQALECLSSRTAPDYRNSIKEAILAVEAAARELAGDNKATLSEAIRAIKERRLLHPAQEQAMNKMYAYTSDADGIRHSMVDEPNLDVADAKYMLVICSAFVNLLTARRA